MRPIAALVVAVVASCGGAAPVPRVLDLNRTGEYVDVTPHLVAGMVTIVDFRADWCAACDKVLAMVLADLGDAPVVIRRVDVGEGGTPVARAYDVGVLPHLRLFDRNRRLRYILVGNDTLRTAELARVLLAE
jgi:thiol-disulfide isomerase/thioredoxin